VNFLSNITRNEGDPKILHTGPSSLSSADRLGKALGWFSIGLGVVELLGARMLTRTLGMRGREGLVRLFGLREIFAGMLCLSTEKQTGMWARVGGDALDIAALLTAFGGRRAKRGNLNLALFTVASIALLDIFTAERLSARHRRGRGELRDYSDRSGLGNGFDRSAGSEPRRNGAYAD